MNSVPIGGTLTSTSGLPKNIGPVVQLVSAELPPKEEKLNCSRCAANEDSTMNYYQNAWESLKGIGDGIIELHGAACAPWDYFQVCAAVCENLY